MIIGKKLNYILLAMFFGLWSSLGSDPYDFLIIFENKNDIYFSILNLDYIEIINFFRAFLPIIIFITSLGIILRYNLFTKQKKFIYLLLIIQVIQLVTTYLSKDTLMLNYEDTINHIGRYHWIISAISTIFIFMIANKLRSFDIKLLFNISVFFLVVIIFYFTSKILIDFYLLAKNSVYHLDVFRESAFFLDHQIPRITGLSRSILIIYIITFIFNENTQHFFKKINFLLLLILGGLIFLFQSKFAVIGYFVINFIFFINSKNKINILKLLFVLFLFQILLAYSLSYSRIFFQEGEKKLTSTNQNSEKTIELEHFRKIEDNTKDGIDLYLYKISSGRFELWAKSINLILERPFLGYGSMSDRFLLNENRLSKSSIKIVNPISNAFLYALFSGGIISLLVFIYFWQNIRNKIFNLFLDIELNKTYNFIGSSIIFIIGLRCFVENSIMLFGIDYLLLLSALYLTEKR